MNLLADIKIGPYTFLSDGHVLDRAGHVILKNSPDGQFLSFIFQFTGAVLGVALAFGVVFLLKKLFLGRNNG